MQAEAFADDEVADALRGKHDADANRLAMCGGRP
jgi:hypothetical protein